MNVQTYLSQLGSLFPTDANQRPISQNTLTLWLANATRAYGVYRGLKRQFGEGGLAADAKVGDTTVTVVGGPFAAGDVITLDSYTPWSEQASVTAVARAPRSTFASIPLKLTLSVPLSQEHPAGGIVANVNLGLTLVPSQAQYYMPTDFTTVEQMSWSLAIGDRLVVKQQEGFYDGVYRCSEPIQGVDLGMAQNFLGGSAGLAGAIPGLPGIPPGVVNLPNQPASTYSFSESEPYILTISPAPINATTLYFYYWASQLPETIPDSDQAAVFEMGCYFGHKYNHSIAVKNLSYSQGSVREDWSSTALRLENAMGKCLDQWNNLVVMRPLAVSG